MTHSLIDDLSTLTTIPTSNLKNLVEKSKLIICDCVEESKLENDDHKADINIGIGTLSIYIKNGTEVAYKFVPNKALNTAVTDTILNGKNPLVELAENTLTGKFLKTYKDYI